MSDTKGILDYWSTAFKHLGPLKNHPALFFAAFFVLVTIPLLIFGDPTKMEVPMGLLVAFAVFALSIHLVRDYLLRQQWAKPPGITSTIEVQKILMGYAVSIPKLDKPALLQTNTLMNFSSFWDQDEGAMVSVEGTLSRFAPFIIGPHKLKREVHLKFRKKIEQLEQQGKSLSPSANAILSFTAGQMV